MTEAKELAWWTREEGQRHGPLFSQVEKIEEITRRQRSDDVLHMRMYGNRNVAGMGGEVRWRSRDRFRLRFNLGAMIIDSLQAKIAKLRPRPRFLTNRGEWSERKKAEAMEQAVDGEFYRNDIDQKSPQVVLDGLITGTGFWRVGRDGSGFPKIERGFPLEVLIDPMDGFYGAPRMLHHLRLMDKQVVLAKWGGEKGSFKYRAIDKIENGDERRFQFMLTRDSTIDQILVVESFRLPSTPDSEDGLHMVAVRGTDLPAEPWERDHFPYAWYRWQKRQAGFWGRGVMEEIKPQQTELNHTLEKIQAIIHRVSTVRTWIQGGGKISLTASKLTNTPGEVLTYHGANPPVTEVINAVPRELFEHIERIKQDAFNRVGLSELSATSQKPAGLDSGEAIRAFEDVGSERLVLKGREYELAHMDVAKLIVEEKNAIAEDPDEKEKPVISEVRTGRGATVRTINWGEAKLEEGKYIMKVLPQSGLPGTPSGRIATVEGWLNAGLIAPDEARRMLDFPDLEAEMTMAQATRDNILSAIEVMVDEGEYVTPEPMNDLNLGLRLVAVAYNRFRWEGAPEAHLELLTRYNDDIIAMQEDAARQEQEAALLAQGPAPVAGALPPEAAAAPAQLPPEALQPPLAVA